MGTWKVKFFIDILLWVSCYCIHQAYYVLYIFWLLTSKHKNTKVCSIIPISKKPFHVETSQPICIAIQSTGSYTLRVPCKKKFSDKLQYTYKMQNANYIAQCIVSFLLTLLNIINFDVGIYSLIQISYLTNFYQQGIELYVFCNFLPFYCKLF